jgi:hypothetical protein
MGQPYGSQTSGEMLGEMTMAKHAGDMKEDLNGGGNCVGIFHCIVLCVVVSNLIIIKMLPICQELLLKKEAGDFHPRPLKPNRMLTDGTRNLFY